MSKSTRIFLRIILTFSILFTGLASSTGSAHADSGDLVINPPIITAGEECGQIIFSFSWENGIGNESYLMDFGNEDTTPHGEVVKINDNSITLKYTYPAQGDYQWTFQIGDVSINDTLTIGPKVTLTSEDFPPLFVVGGDHEVKFITEVHGDDPPFTYAWNLGIGIEGTIGPDGSLEEGSASGIYTEVGKYYPEVVVTDKCGFTSSDTIPVVVADPENACHPMAQKIADGINTIFPDQVDDLYTCDEIYAIFDNENDENNIGFGRMWQAYRLAQNMEELGWEDILDWHLNEGGWGSLLQLDRFADSLGDDFTLPELMSLTMSEDYSLSDVRTAVRSVTRYEADFEDVLEMILEGANTGDINQAYKLATDEVSAADILDMGVQAYRESLREEEKEARDLLREENKNARAGEEKQAAQTEEKTQQTAEKLAEQFTAEFGDVMSLLNGECEGDWACVRKALRDQEQEMSEGYSDKDQQTAQQIGSKYGYDEEVVLKYHKDNCGENWACTRAYFREHTLIIKETGKPEKPGKPD